MELSGFKINLVFPMFVDQMAPVGFLNDDPACHALWYYYICATNARAGVGKGPEDQVIEFNAESGTDIPLWRDKHYNNQIKSIAFLYGLESPEPMMKYWPNVKLEINRLGLTPVADEIENLTGHDRIT